MIYFSWVSLLLFGFFPSNSQHIWTEELFLLSYAAFWLWGSIEIQARNRQWHPKHSLPFPQ